MNTSALNLVRSIASPSVSSPAVVEQVFRKVDRVVVCCSDGSTRQCVALTASAALGRNVSVDDVYSRLLNRVGQEVVFISSGNWSADKWFVATVPVAHFFQNLL